MDEKTLQALRPGVTIRQAAASASISDTLARTSPDPLRGLPRLSIDLRDLSGLTAEPRTSSQSDLQVHGVIGEGGMGRVLLARQHSLARDVAVKTAKEDANAAARESILWEGAISGQLEHPAIVPVHALGLDEEGRPALVMKRIEGVGWDGLLVDPAHAGWEGWDGTPADRLAGHLQILVSVCNAIHFAHSKGIVHRDIKPENVLIGRFGDVYLADWGVATRMTAGPSQLCGTPGYMAPEMATGATVDERTDVYLLGSTLHMILTGTMRHPGPTVKDALALATDSKAFDYRAAIPRELAELANRACHVDPAQRPATAKAFRDELTLYARHRDARSLADQAMQRMAELETLLKVPAPTDDQQQQLERVLAEARFGLGQALAQWSENVPAREALIRLEAIVEQRRARTSQLERAERERDPRHGAASRILGMTGLLVMDIVMAIVAATGDEAPSPIRLLSFPLVAFVALLVGALALRKQVLRTALNRQMLWCLLIGLGFMVIGRTVGLFVPIPPHEHFARDAFMLAGTLAIIAVAFMRWAVWCAVAFLVCGVLVMVFPEKAVPIFSASTVLVVGIGLLASWISGRNVRP